MLLPDINVWFGLAVSSHERVLARRDRVPRTDLRRGRGLERRAEPGLRGGGEPAEDVARRGHGVLPPGHRPILAPASDTRAPGPGRELLPKVG